MYVHSFLAEYNEYFMLERIVIHTNSKELVFSSFFLIISFELCSTRLLKARRCRHTDIVRIEYNELNLSFYFSNEHEYKILFSKRVGLLFFRFFNTI